MDFVFEHYYEDHYERMNDEQKETTRQELIETKEQAFQRMLKEEAEKADADAFAKLVAKEAEENEKLEFQKKVLKPALTPDSKESPLFTQQESKPDISMTFIDDEEMDRLLSEDSIDIDEPQPREPEHFL